MLVRKCWKKMLLSMALCLSMMVGILSGMGEVWKAKAGTDDPAGESESESSQLENDHVGYGIWIGGVQFTSERLELNTSVNSNFKGSAKLEVKPGNDGGKTTYILTLDNFSNNNTAGYFNNVDQQNTGVSPGDLGNFITGAGIICDGEKDKNNDIHPVDLVIRIKGTNIITVPDKDDDTYSGFFSTEKVENVTICRDEESTGDDSSDILQIFGRNKNTKKDMGAKSSCYGMYVRNTLTMQSGTVTAGFGSPITNESGPRTLTLEYGKVIGIYCGSLVETGGILKGYCGNIGKTDIEGTGIEETGEFFNNVLKNECSVVCKEGYGVYCSASLAESVTGNDTVNGIMVTGGLLIGVGGNGPQSYSHSISEGIRYLIVNAFEEGFLDSENEDEDEDIEDDGGEKDEDDGENESDEPNLADIQPVNVFEAIHSESDVVIKSGTVAVTGQTYGIRAANTYVEDGNVTIIGGEKAVSGKLKNDITGTGWTDENGTKNVTYIDACSENTSPYIPGITVDKEFITFRKMVFPTAHVHAFSYALKKDDDATIVATCEEEGCTNPVASAEITLVKPAKTQADDNGSEKATLKNLDTFNSVTGLKISASDIVYYSGTTKLDAAPSEGGTYTAKLTVGTGENAVTASVEYKIKAVYTIVWLKDDGTVLDTKTYVEGEEEPTTDKIPAKDPDTKNTYTFKEWELKEDENGNKTYVPVFDAIPIPHVHAFSYALKEDDSATIVATCEAEGCTDPAATAELTLVKPVKTQADDNGSPLASLDADQLKAFNTLTGLSVSAGDIVYYSGTTKLDGAPSEAGTYTAKLTVGTGENTATAFVEYKIKAVLTVIWLNGDGSELDRKMYVEGEKEPTTDKTPTKADDENNTYTFKNTWTAKENGKTITYTPDFEAKKIEYTYIWKDRDGTELGRKTVKKGEEPTTPDKDPDMKQPTKNYKEGGDTFEFVGWKKVSEGDDGKSRTFEPVYEKVTYTTDPEKLETDENGAPGAMKVHRSPDDDSCYDHFVCVKSKSGEMDKSLYEAGEGCTEIKLKKEAIESLGIGTHRITVVFDDGEVSFELIVKEAAKEAEEPAPEPAKEEKEPSANTGDTGNLWIWAILAMMSAGAAGGVYATRRMRGAR